MQSLENGFKRGPRRIAGELINIAPANSNNLLQAQPQRVAVSPHHHLTLAASLQ
jgi:hypothetical protein